MTAYRSYLAYKSSGVEWLGDLPDHWAIRRLKFLANINTETLSDTTLPDYKIQYIDIGNVSSNGEIQEIQELVFESAPSRARRKVRGGDTIISTVRTYLKAIAYLNAPPSNCIVSTGFAVLRPREFVNPKYLYYLVRSQGFVDAVMAHSTGVSYPAIAPTTLAGLWGCLPSLVEQQAIAAYLDRETVRLDSLIAKKRELIDLLHNQRTAIISHAVTKGLDPAAPLKPSGVEWLGDVPGHWEANLVKRFFQIDLGKMLDTSKQKEEVGEIKPYLRAANIFWEGVWLDDIKNMKFSKEQLRRYRLKKGDLLVTEGGVTVGRSAIWREEIEECYYQNSINRARQKGDIPVEYLYYWLHFLKLNGFIEIMAEKATFGHLTKEKLETIPICIPSSLEARTIAQYLDGKLQHIGEVIAQIDQSILLLQKQRTALISAAVTGKIDVRSEEPV